MSQGDMFGPEDIDVPSTCRVRMLQAQSIYLAAMMRQQVELAREAKQEFEEARAMLETWKQIQDIEVQS